MLKAEQLLYETEKQPPEVFYKDAVLKNFAIFTGNHLREEHLRTAASELTLWSDSLEICFWIAFKTIVTQ